MKVADLQSIRIKISSPQDILSWSHGEVKKPETINYRTQRPEKDGLFCERIFGPSKDFECYCGKYKGIRFKGIICDRCAVEVTRSSVRRDRMGHIKLAAPVSHIWFLRGVPSRIGMVLDISAQKLEKVIYFASYIVISVDKEAKKNVLNDVEDEYKQKFSELEKDISKNQKEKIAELKDLFHKRKEEISKIAIGEVLTEAQYREFSLNYGEMFTAGTGAETLRDIFKKINFKEELKILEEKAKHETGLKKKKTMARLKLFQSMGKANLRPEWMFFEVLPVLPPDLRPMVQLDGGRYASSDLNDLYRRVINRNNRLKYLLEIKAPDVIVRNEKRMLQEAVDALFDNKMRKSQTTTATSGGKRLLKSLADVLSGKQGRFRRNLLGKRVDYSGRSVIAPGPELSLHQCGLPKIMALELFRPFVVKKLLDKELAYNIRGAARLIDEGIDEVWASLEEVVAGKYVLLNRAPTLHRLGIQAFEPRLIEGEAIKVHPLVCKSFNADFDGDQMAVYLPLSVDAQKEAESLMLASKNLLKPADGLPVVTPAKDMILGVYFLTTIKDKAKGEGKAFCCINEALMALELGDIEVSAKIKIQNQENELIETSCGRLIFNEILPKELGFCNEQINSKKLSQLISTTIEKCPTEIVEKMLDDIKALGFEYSTLSGVSWGMDDLKVPEEKKGLLELAEKEVDKIESHFKKGFLSKKERGAKLIEIWQEVKSKIEKLVPESLDKLGPVYAMIDSGARGSWAQLVQMAGMKGLVTSPSGRIIELPVKNSFKEGFDVLEYFISTHGARKGTADTALRTSASGYLTRRLADVAHELIITEENCSDKEGLEVKRSDATEVGQDFRFKVVGRIAAEDIKLKGEKTVLVKKGQEIDWQAARQIEQSDLEKLKIFSPLTCKAKRGLCQKCYGWEMGNQAMCKLGDAVGIVAAQSIGEPGTQLTMRTFHTGGVSSVGDITRGLPRIEEIFEARIPKGQAILSMVQGKTTEVDLDRSLVKISTKNKTTKKDEVVEYILPADAEILVKKGDEVKKGQALCMGSFDLKKFFRFRGVDETKCYILKEIQKIYNGEGIDIHDKHIEAIVRQMFSRVRIVEGEASPWVSGQIISVAEFEEINAKLKKDGKTQAKAKQILLGISRVSITSDSFLSAASFQETSRVLIKAALEAKEDKLYGLKENVIIGRLIPAGTGLRKRS